MRTLMQMLLDRKGLLPSSRIAYYEKIKAELTLKLNVRLIILLSNKDVIYICLYRVGLQYFLMLLTDYVKR